MGRNHAAKPLGEQLANWNPDLVFAHHGRAASNLMFIDRLRSRGVRTACYLCDEPYETGETVTYSKNFDLVFTMDPCTLEPHRLTRAKREGVFYLPPGVHTDRFTPQPYFGEDGRLCRDVPAFFLGNGTLVPRPSFFEPVNRLVDGADFRYLKTVSKANKGDWIPLSEHPRMYSNCVVGLNVHRAPWINEKCYKDRVVNRHPQFPVPAGLTIPKTPPAEGWGTGFWNDANLPASHLNPRFLEMAACGTLVVSDNHRSELARMFPGVPQAEDPEHFLELVFHYIAHPEEAEAIGLKCSSLISSRHSYKHRAAEVLIRAGLQAQLPVAQLSSLGEPEDWLSPQDWQPHGDRSPLGPTGPSERWHPRSGMSWTRQSGNSSDMLSVDAPTPWLL
jgi:spore maturation protein CgeB